MATAKHSGMQPFVGAVSSLPMSSETSRTEDARYKRFSVKLKRGTEIPCYLEPESGEKNRRLLQAFLTIHDISKDLALEKLVKTTGRAPQPEGVTTPDGRREGVVISSKKEGHFSVITFCSFQPVDRHYSEAALALKIPYFAVDSRHSASKTLRYRLLAKDGLANEIQVQRHLNHPNIVPMLGYIEQSGSFPVGLMVMPRMAGNLKAILDEPRSVQLKVKHCRELFAGLGYLHEKKFCHRDLKSSNCLIGYDGVLRICDFGMVRKHDGKGVYLSANATGSKGYWPPEIRTLNQDKKRVYGIKGDVFASGIIMAQAMGFHEGYCAHVSSDPGGEITWLTSKEYFFEKGACISQVLPEALSRRKLTWEELMEQGYQYEVMPFAGSELTPELYQKEEMACIIGTCLRSNMAMRPDSATVYRSILKTCQQVDAPPSKEDVD